MISVIIPVLNEAAVIKQLLQFLVENNSGKNTLEIIIVDGGSCDETCKIVKNYALASAISVRLIASEKGRAKQMNAGAKIAVGNILYFLHADCFPPKNFDSYIFEEVNKGNLAGCFCMKFRSNHWWLKFVSWCTQFRWRICRGGDQSQFITKALFWEIGGFNENYRVYEDNILINELYKRKTFTVIQQWLTTSARLYKQKGIWNVQYHYLAIYAKRRLGADARELYAYYSKNIKISENNTFSNTEFLEKNSK